jgi:hypothetical protein
MTNRIARKFGSILGTGVLVLGWTGGKAFSQTNLIVNGSFEKGPDGVESFPSWVIGPASNNSNFGVTKSGVSPQVSQQGTNYAYFHGHPTDSSQDCLGQYVNLVVGAQYTITYSLGTDGPTIGSGAYMDVAMGTSFGVDLTQDLLLNHFVPNSSNAIPYQRFTTNVTATAASEILSFHGVNSASSILLDNVSLTLAIPRLSLGLSQTNTIIFTWPTPNAGYRLQANSSLNSTNWVTMTNQPATVASNNQIVLPITAGNKFYRLTLP